jgi:hypothetical protein
VFGGGFGAKYFFLQNSLLDYDRLAQIVYAKVPKSFPYLLLVKKPKQRRTH